MSRYFTQAPRSVRPRADWSDDYPLLSDIHVPEHGPVDTGLVDKRGAAIMRAPNLMGFGRHGEW